MPEILDIYILDVNKQNSVVSSTIQIDPWQTEWYKSIIESDSPAVWFGLSNTSYLKGVSVGIPVFGLGRKVIDVETGKIIGVMFIEVIGNVLSKTLDDVKFGQTGYTYVIDQNNNFAYHRDPSLFWQSFRYGLAEQDTSDEDEKRRYDGYTC